MKGGLESGGIEGAVPQEVVEGALSTVNLNEAVERTGYIHDLDQLQALDKSDLEIIDAKLQAEIEAAGYGEDGSVLNENRAVVEALSARKKVVEELLDSVSSVVRAAEVFERVSE